MVLVTFVYRFGQWLKLLSRQLLRYRTMFKNRSILFENIFGRQYACQHKDIDSDQYIVHVQLFVSFFDKRQTARVMN